MIILESMELGLSLGEFFLEHLPTISLADGRCTGAEALIRWRRPDNVTIPPGDFIPIAENTRFSGTLTYCVIERVAVELKTWLRANPDAKNSGSTYRRKSSDAAESNTQRIEVDSANSQINSSWMMTERGIPDIMAVTATNDYLSNGGCVALDDVTLVGGGNLAVLARCHISIIAQ